MENERDLDERPVLTPSLFFQLTALFVLLSVVSAADLVFRGLRRHPLPTQAPLWSIPGGIAERGEEAIHRYGCTACHTFPGLQPAEGRAGPGLEEFRSRVFIAGRLPNTPEQLMKWIQDPREIDPETAMPDLDVTDADARHIAAYLYADH
jgi:cytochrome c2